MFRKVQCIIDVMKGDDCIALEFRSSIPGGDRSTLYTMCMRDILFNQD